MNKARLNTLADYLATVPKKHFDLDSWVHIDGGEFEDGRITKVGCDTTCCAFGWACSIPSFRKAGLQLDMDYEIPMFKGEQEVDAATEFFKITFSQAVWLFAPREYSDRQLRNPKYVIARLRDLTGEQKAWKKREKSSDTEGADDFNAYSFYAG